MIEQTTNEKVTAALWEATRVLNLILNESPPSGGLYDRARRAYDGATNALRYDQRDKLIRDIETPTPKKVAA